MQLLSQSKPKLGASIADAASQAKKRPGIPQSGAYIGGVKQGSPAKNAGLKAGDVIVALGGQPVARAADLHRLVRTVPQDRDVSLTYVRNGAERDTLVRL
jgi:S1-C subfamily serine protease